jgi:hypothetical protein
MTDLLTKHFEHHDADLRDGKIDGLTHLHNYTATLRRALRVGVTRDQYRYAISAARKRLGNADNIDPEFADADEA